MTALCAADLLRLRLDQLAAAGVKHPDRATVVGEILRVRDLSHPMRPIRTMRFTATAEPAVAIETICRGRRLSSGSRS